MEDYSQKLLELLVEQGRLPKKKAQDILAAAIKSEEPADAIIYAAGMMEKPALLRAKGELYKSPTLDLSTYEVDPGVAAILPKAMSERYHAVCVGRKDGKIMTAMDDPTDSFGVSYIKMRTGLELDVYVALGGDIENVRTKVYSEGPPPSATPAGLRDRIGQEVRGSTVHVASRQKIQSTSLIDGLLEKPKAPRQIKLDGEAPARDLSTVPTLGAHRTVSAGDVEDLTPRSRAQESAVAVAGRTSSAEPAVQARRYEVMSRLAHVSLDLITALDEDTLVDKILDVAGSIFDVEAVSLLLVDWEHSQLFFRKARGPVKDEIINFTVPLNDNSVAGWVAKHGEPANIRDAQQDDRHYEKMDQQLRFTTRNLLAVPVKHGNDVLGVLEIINKRDGNFDETDTDFLTILAAHTAVALANTLRLGQLNNFYHQTIEILIDCLQAFDPVSRAHLLNVARLATAIATPLQISALDMETLSYASLLHDLGKIKCGDPTDPNHSVLGAELLSEVALFSRIVPIVRAHHEHYDGSGYPDGLRGEDIPLLARILAVAEAFFEESGVPGAAESDTKPALDAFLARFGTAFDPALKEPFLRVLREQ